MGDDHLFLLMSFLLLVFKINTQQICTFSIYEKRENPLYILIKYLISSFEIEIFLRQKLSSRFEFKNFFYYDE